MMVRNEIDRMLLHYFLRVVADDTFHHLSTLMEEQDHQGVANVLADSVMNWRLEQMKHTTDEVFRAVLQFVHMVGYYESFYSSIRNGDAIMIELLYLEFLQVEPVAY